MASRVTRLAALVGTVVVVAVSLASMRSSASASLNAATSQPPPWASTGLIAYKCGDSLCLMRPDGSGKRKVHQIAGPGPQWDPAFSPDGRMLAFRGYYGIRDGQYAIYVVGADGCSIHRLTRSVAGNPSWSPDGRWIAFDTSGNGEIWKIHPNGTGLTRITRGGRAGQDSSPTWSPDGTRIVFVRYHRGHAQIWVMRADGSRAAVIHKDAQDLRGMPAWSHDGTRIAFVTQTWPRSSIQVMDANGSNVRALTRQRGGAWNPIWLPHDAGIAFLDEVDGARSLFVMRPNGRDPQRLALQDTQEFAWTNARLPQQRC
jgi:TolB protein